MSDIVERLKDAEIATHALFDYIFQHAREEIERLRAKVEAMENQEPVAVVDYKRGSCVRFVEFLGWQKIANGAKLYALPVPPAPSALAEAIIADMQAQHDSELITENDSGEALIRLDGATAAVEDNFALAQPTPSVPEDVMRDAERYRYLRARDEGTAGVGCWLEADGRACDRGWLYGDQLDSAIDTCIEMPASAPEVKPCP